MILKSIPVSAYMTNCYLLGDEGAGVCALVDPGGNAPALVKLVADAGLALKLILVTHGHDDHVGAVADLRKTFPDVPVYLHREDYAEQGGAKMHQLAPVSNVVLCGAGDEISLGGLTIHVLETPGHTPGGLTFQVGEVLFTGDTLFRGSMGRTDFPGGSYETIMASLKQLAELPGDYQVCPGHEGLTTLETERKSNYYLREAMGG